MIKNMIVEIRKVFNLMGRGKWIVIAGYLIYFLAYSFAQYVLLTSACQYLLDGSLGGDWELFKKGLYYIGLLCIFICIIIPLLYGIVELVKIRLNANLRDRIFEHLLKLPINFFETHSSSAIVGVILNNLDGVYETMSNLFSTIMECSVLGILAIYFLIAKGFVAGIFITMILGGLTGFISLQFAKKVRRQNDTAQTKLGDTNSVISFMFDDVCCQKIYNISDAMYKDFEKSDYMYVNAIKDIAIKNNVSDAARGFIGNVNYLSILIIGILLMINGQKTIGEIMAILTITNTLYYATTKFLMLIQNSQWCLVCADKIIDFLNTQQEINIDNWVKPSNCSALIQFEDVSFQYQKGNTILKNLNLKIDKNEKVNLVGYSGNGKSTVIKLILGFYKDYQGSITIDGFEIKDTSDQKLKQYVSYVSQDNLLFNCSVRENIQYGNFNASDEEIIRVAKDVALHDFIMSLPQKYDTVVSVGGGNFSQEQCSKIAIARAMLKKAPIVILDEAMAKISPKNEIEIKAILDKLTCGKTVINIAHKLTSIPNDERIIVFEKGRIVEDGTKKELLARDSVLEKYVIG